MNTLWNSERDRARVLESTWESDEVVVDRVDGAERALKSKVELKDERRDVSTSPKLQIQ